MNSGPVNNCYNVGNIFGKNAGGIIGYIPSGTVQNCYNSGIVTGTSLAGAIAYRTYYAIAKECYYEEETASSGIGSGPTTGTTEVAKGNMPTILSIINGEGVFIEDTENINNGYPILAWQVE